MLFIKHGKNRMLTSKEALLKEAKEKGYKPEILEKVYRLLDTLQQFTSVPYLKERFVLKGGTALNLFYFDPVPRLSVDIDLNYIGYLDQEKMLEERHLLTEAIQQILQQNQFERYRSPTHHAGGKMMWFYNSVLGQRGLLEIDINFMYRQPLFPINFKEAKIPGYTNWQVPVLDIHELAAGKLTALFNRRVSRDLFDAYQLMATVPLDFEKLRLAFVVYLAMTEIDLSTLTPAAVHYDLIDLKNRLLPVLQQNNLPRTQPALKNWANELLQTLQDKLSKLLPLKQHEIEFVEQIRIVGQIKPVLMTDDPKMMDIIQNHPALLWVAKKKQID